MIVAVDFDDTITMPSPFPITGKVRKDAIFYIKKMYENGVMLILWTCRVDNYLSEATAILKINDNISGSSRKVYADFYIDDKSMQINWKKIYKEVCRRRRILNEK